MLVDGHTGCVSKDLVSVIFPKRLSVVIVATTATIIGENSDMRQYGIASPASFPSATQEAIITVSNCTTNGHYTYSLHTLTLSIQFPRRLGKNHFAKSYLLLYLNNSYVLVIV